MKLAVFVDQMYWFDGQVYSTDEAYILFPSSFASAFDEVVFLGRLAPDSARKPYVLDHPALKVCLLPYYDSVYDLWKAGPHLYREIRQVVRANADRWDVVWVCGPNPVGQFIARQCIGLGRPVFLVVRQNLVRQMRFANRGVKQVMAVITARWLEQRFRRLAMGRTVFAVGQEMAKTYGAVTDRVHTHFPCLVSEAQMAASSAMPAEPETDHLLCVGRLSREKGYHHLLDALARLKARGVACSLDVVGSGPQCDALKAQTAALGLEGEVTFHGYVAYGPELFALYHRATALVVPSLSEGFPQVISEALCVGLPIVVSAVGGIPAFLTHMETAVLVPPADILALTDAIEQVLNSPDLRENLRRNGRALMCDNTLEAQRERMMQVIQQEILSERRHTFRSALADYPGGSPPAQPTVSAVVPMYNEVAHIRSVVEALLAQDYPALNEIWFVDGQSDDGTFEELQRLRERDRRIKVLNNPHRNQAAAINLAFSQAQSDLVIRLDGHAQYAPDVIRQSVQVLLKTGAGGVGAIARPLASGTLIGQSIAAAHESRLGVGVARFRQASASGWVDTVWNGCYWKHVVDRVGPLREDLPRSEDNDFNARVRALGYGLYLSPRIRAYYYPRQSLRELWCQYSANGAGMMWALFENRQAIELRHLVPLVFVASLLLSLVVSVFWSPALVVLGSVLLLYLLALLLFSVIAWHKRPGRYVMLLPVIFATLHASYGLGSIQFLFQFVYRALKCRLQGSK
jgi:glycosyltransferase involved in cell wall biosynthesis